MDSSLCTLSKLFTEKLFRIPDFQRGYSWTDRQLKDFWSDLEQINEDQRHYTGVLTLEPVNEKTWSRWEDDEWAISGKNYKPYYVVDGQQRLTTIIILMQCILEKTKSHESLNFNSKSEIQTKFIFLSKTTHHGTYVFGYAKDNPSYECLKTHILGKTSTRYSTGENTIYTKNLISAKNFFTEKVKSLNQQALETVFKKITQKLLFNVFYIDDEVDVHVAFETMNNRGLQLSNLELLKNRLIYLTTKLGESKSNIELTRKTINDCWKSVYYYLGKNPKTSLNDDEFLFIHFVMHYGQKVLTQWPRAFEHGFLTIQHREIYKDFLLQNQFNVRRIYAEKAEERLNSTELLNYGLDLKKTAEGYYYAAFPEDSSYSSEVKTALTRLKRLRVGAHGRELMAAILLFLPHFKEQAPKLDFLNSIERYFFISGLLPYAFKKKNKLVNISEQIVHLIGKRSGGDDFLKLVKEELKTWEAMAGFRDAIVDGLGESSYYGWVDVRYFLFEYELHLKQKVKRKTDKIEWSEFIAQDFEDDYDSIEHILPQTISFPYWKDAVKGLEARKQKRLKNSLGNLLALSKPRNSSLRNAPFPDKKGNKNSNTGYLFGSYSENEVALYSDWGPMQILERGLKLLEFMEQRWGLDLGTNEEKKKLLGLEFLT